jgi:hypothetical protein
VNTRLLTAAGVALIVLMLARSPRASTLQPAGIDPRTLPIGMYAGQAPLPQQARVVLVDQLNDSLMGPPGIRESLSTNRTGKYWGTDVVPAPRYPTGSAKSKANRPEDIEMAPIQALAPRGGFPR